MEEVLLDIPPAASTVDAQSNVDALEVITRGGGGGG